MVITPSNRKRTTVSSRNRPKGAIGSAGLDYRNLNITDGDIMDARTEPNWIPYRQLHGTLHYRQVWEKIYIIS